MLRLLIVVALSVSTLSASSAEEVREEILNVDSMPVIGVVPRAAFCDWRAVDELPLSRASCNLARQFGDPEQWVTAPQRTRLAFRVAIHRAFLVPSIVRIEIESSVRATLTQTYGLPTRIDEVIDLSPTEIRIIVRGYQRADVWNAPVSMISPECPNGSLAVLDIAVTNRFRTIISCSEKASAMSLLMGIDEIIRSHRS